MVIETQEPPRTDMVVFVWILFLVILFYNGIIYKYVIFFLFYSLFQLYRRKLPFIVVLCSCSNEGRTLTPDSADKAGHVYTSTTRWQVVHTIQLLLLTSLVYAMSTTAVYKELIEGVFPKQSNTRTHTRTRARCVYQRTAVGADACARDNQQWRTATNKQTNTHTERRQWTWFCCCDWCVQAPHNTLYTRCLPLAHRTS